MGAKSRPRPRPAVRCPFRLLGHFAADSAGRGCDRSWPHTVPGPQERARVFALAATPRSRGLLRSGISALTVFGETALRYQLSVEAAETARTGRSTAPASSASSNRSRTRAPTAPSRPSRRRGSSLRRRHRGQHGVAGARVCGGVRPAWRHAPELASTSSADPRGRPRHGSARGSPGCGRQHAAGHGQHVAPLLERPPRRDQGSAPVGRLHDHHGRCEPLIRRLRSGSGAHGARLPAELGDHHPLRATRRSQRPVFRRITGDRPRSRARRFVRPVDSAPS